ncbi:hypothetical protein HPB50_011231 [Hyalomma asiaticum]|uniref:Uncharacterized protein n=1 Tax=Hyalomma asiaticum TaxID=266040 RepID=A0ACB7SXD2_HYAAI|nr:hypothetical protein HPB50_011231 [Hyalomma asiaticum]
MFGQKQMGRYFCRHWNRCLSNPSSSTRDGGTRADTMPPPKEHFFNVRTPPRTSVDEVIDALEALLGTPEIYSVQHFGGLDFHVGVNSLEQFKSS